MPQGGGLKGLSDVTAGTHHSPAVQGFCLHRAGREKERKSCLAYKYLERGKKPHEGHLEDIWGERHAINDVRTI